MLPSASPIGFGAAGLGNLFGEMTPETAWDLCEEAWQAEMRYFDTAPHYGLGLSEQRLGAYLCTRPREEYVLSTKVGRILEPVPNPSGELDLANDFHVPANYRRREDFSRSGIERSIAESLERLGLDHVDLLYLHDPDKAAIGMRAALEQGLAALQGLKDQGVVGAIGIGSMSTEALAAGIEMADLDVLMVAGRYTLLEQPGAGLLDRCAELGVRAVVASVFNSGLLASPTPRADARYEYQQVPRDIYRRTLEIAGVCSSYGVELPAAALQFPLRHPAVAALVTGINSRGQCAQNVARARAPIPEELWHDLEQLGVKAPGGIP